MRAAVVQLHDELSVSPFFLPFTQPEFVGGFLKVRARKFCGGCVELGFLFGQLLSAKLRALSTTSNQSRSNPYLRTSPAHILGGLFRERWLMEEAGITQLLLKWSEGDETSLNQLTPLVYEELRRLARSYLR